MRTQRNGLVLLAAALASAACGGSSGGSSGGGAIGGSSGDKAATGSVAMAMTNYSFAPAVLNGTPGEKQTIHLTNASGRPHTFTIQAQSVNEIVQGGATADVTVTFPTTGQLVFVCTYHAARGMTGTLVAGSGAASPAANKDKGKGGGYSYY